MLPHVLQIACGSSMATSSSIPKKVTFLVCVRDFATLLIQNGLIRSDVD